MAAKREESAQSHLGIFEDLESPKLCAPKIIFHVLQVFGALGVAVQFSSVRVMALHGEEVMKHIASRLRHDIKQYYRHDVDYEYTVHFRQRIPRSFMIIISKRMCGRILGIGIDLRMMRM